jgi:EAL domain-containing protein (putative c-di-GMP-specific phosphodiesterase class I)
MSIHQLIEEENFYHYSQGLFNTGSWERIGGEILLRSEFGPPDVIFEKAKVANKLYELDTKSIFNVLHNYNLQDSTQKDLLFINIFPSTILHSDFPDFILNIKNTSLRKDNSVVFEIIETDFVENISFFKERIKFLKNLGYLIAIDDVGKGWSSLHMIIELDPDYIKLDRYFSLNLSKSKPKQEMIKSFIHFTKYSKSKLVLEGIECEKDLAIAKVLGVDICQGFLLDKPKPISSLNLNL